MRLEVARDRSAAVVLDVAGQQVRRRGRRVSSDDDGDHFSAANRRSAHQRAGAGQVLAERLTVRLIRFYTLPTWDQRIQYQTCYNLPLSRAKLWVVSQLWCCTSLQDVASVTGPGGPLDAALCMPAERSWDQPARLHRRSMLPRANSTSSLSRCRKLLGRPRARRCRLYDGTRCVMGQRYLQYEATIARQTGREWSTSLYLSGLVTKATL